MCRKLVMVVSAALGIVAAGWPQAQPVEICAIVGVVRFTGKVPPPQKILTTDGGTLEHSDLVVDPKTKGLRHVVAVLEDAPARPVVKKAKPVLMDQRDMLFLPRVVAVQQGQAVRFDNNDLCNHSVMTASTVRANQFNVFILPNQPQEHVFEPQKHPVQIGCALHPWMRAYVYVMPHPWYAVSDTQGRFQIENIPPGTYSLWLRHPDTGKQERRKVTVKAGAHVEVSVEWDKADP